MISRLLKILGGSRAGAVASGEERKRLAAAVLLVEAARLDGHVDEVEREAIRKALQAHFSLSPEDAAALLAAGEAKADDATSLVPFTRAIKENYAPQERVEIVEMLWEVVYADRILHELEDNLLRRIGGLIYVSDRERAEARKRVLRRLGIEQ